MAGCTATVWDAVASVCADLTGIQHVFSVGATASVRYDEPLVVELQDDFPEAGLPAVVVTLGPHSGAVGHGHTRMSYEFGITVWAERQPVGAQVAVLADAIDELYAGFAEHSKAKLHALGDDFSLQSALITRGTGIEARQFAGPEGQPGRVYLAAPLTAEIKVDRRITPQPA